jgi:hypothetical protein
VQVCQASQVHKIRETNFVDLHYIIYDFKIREQFSKVQETLTSSACLEIFKQNDKVGKGDIFSQENVFIALVA